MIPPGYNKCDEALLLPHEMSDIDEQFLSSTMTLEYNIMTEIGVAVLLWVSHVEYNMLLSCRTQTIATSLCIKLFWTFASNINRCFTSKIGYATLYCQYHNRVYQLIVSDDNSNIFKRLEST